MTTSEIQPGATLRLKPARQEAYGLAERDFTVDSLRYRPGYKTPFIMTADGLAFTPSDFAKRVS